MPIRPENRDRYPANWHEISFRIRFARALGQCECTGECGRGHKTRCTARHNQANPATGSKVVLTVAHLDHTPENCDDSNLCAMCQACHLAYDTEEHAATRARTAAAETATWNTPLPGLEPELEMETDAEAVRTDAGVARGSLTFATGELGKWVHQALCANTDPRIFFPEQGSSPADAKAICDQCPVADDCLEFALPHGWLTGVWGGTTRTERRHLREEATP